MAELTEMPFGMWGGVGPSNYVLDGDLETPGKEQFWGGKGAVP